MPLSGKEYFFRFYRRAIEHVVEESPVLDLGTPSPLRKELGYVKHLFQDIVYYCMDYAPNWPGTPLQIDVSGDIHHLPFRDEIAGGIICKDVLEHVERPLKAVDEMYRVLRRGRYLFATVPFIHPYHPSGYGDYYRFTRQGVNYLFRKFSSVEIHTCGGMLYAILHGYMPSWLFMAVQNSLLFRTIFEYFDRRVGHGGSTILWMVLARK